MRLVLAVVTGVLVAGSAWATADGPDFLRVIGVDPGERLMVRAEPKAKARVVGGLAHDADGIANRGCEGGLSAAAYAEATEDERSAARKTRWCRVAFEGISGWAAGWHLAEGTSPPPVVFACDGVEEPVTATFAADQAHVDVGGDRLILSQVPAASGARYANAEETAVFWTKGREALLERSGGGLVWCLARTADPED